MWCPYISSVPWGIFKDGNNMKLRYCKPKVSEIGFVTAFADRH
jgi:hypothetical protein